MSIEKKRLHIGLFITNMSDSYHAGIWQTLAAHAADEDFNLIIYCGRIIDDDTIHMSVHDLLDPEKTDGLIIVPGFSGEKKHTGQIKLFLDKYNSLPLVTIGQLDEKIPAVCFNKGTNPFPATGQYGQEHGWVIAKKALAILRAMINSEQVPGISYVPAEAENRQSCSNPWQQFKKEHLTDCQPDDSQPTVAAAEFPSMYHTFISSSDTAALIHNLESWLRKLNINACYAGEYDKPVRENGNLVYTLPGWTRVLLFFHNNKHTNLTDEQKQIRTRDLIPFACFPERRYTHLVLPLCYHDYSSGYIIFPYSHSSGSPYGVFNFVDVQLSFLHKINLQIAISAALNDLRTRSELRNAKQSAEFERNLKYRYLIQLNNDFRSPLNTILGFTEILLKRDLEPNTREFIKIINHAEMQLLDLINDMVDIAHIEHGRLEFRRVEFSIRELILKIKQEFSQSMTVQNINFKVHVDQAVPQCIIGDKRWIKKIMSILLTNATPFNIEGKLHVRIGIDADTLIIQVEDTRDWISPSLTKYPFLPFDPEHDSPPWEFSYNDFRLMIAKKLIQQMNGEIFVKCEQDKKTVFTVRLPLREENRNIEKE